MSDERENATRPVLLSDMLEAIAADLDERDRRRHEIDELVAIAAPHIDQGLAMALHAQCAIRGIEWPALLADAARDVLQSRLPN